MRALSLAASILLGGLGLAGSNGDFPSGTYAGTADWRGPGGKTGTYTVEKTFEGNRVTALYTWTDATARNEKHTITFAPKTAEPAFDVVDEKGQSVGTGHCYDDACSYRATFGPVTVDESFRWSGNGMTVLGAKSGPGFSVVWKETLKLR